MSNGVWLLWWKWSLRRETEVLHRDYLSKHMLEQCWTGTVPWALSAQSSLCKTDWVPLGPGSIIMDGTSCVRIRICCLQCTVPFGSHCHPIPHPCPSFPDISTIPNQPPHDSPLLSWVSPPHASSLVQRLWLLNTCTIQSICNVHPMCLRCLVTMILIPRIHAHTPIDRTLLTHAKPLQ